MESFLTIDKAIQSESNTLAVDNKLKLQGWITAQKKQARTTAVIIPHGPYFVVNWWSPWAHREYTVKMGEVVILDNWDNICMSRGCVKIRPTLRLVLCPNDRSWNNSYWHHRHLRGVTISRHCVLNINRWRILLLRLYSGKLFLSWIHNGEIGALNWRSRNCRRLVKDP